MKLKLPALVLMSVVALTSACSAQDSPLVAPPLSNPEKVRVQLSADNPWHRMSDTLIDNGANKLCYFYRSYGFSKQRVYDEIQSLATIASEHDTPGDEFPPITRDQSVALQTTMVRVYCPEFV